MTNSEISLDDRTSCLPMAWLAGNDLQRDQIFIIVPSYNESSVIQDTIAPLLDAGYSVVVIDDGSSDESYAQICRMPVHAIRHPLNLGQGAAIQTGVEYALQKGAGVVVHFDADGQHPPETINDLIAPILSGRADVALGSRFKDKASSRNVPRLKRWVLRCGTLFTGVTSGVWLTDTHNGFRAFSARAAALVRITEPRMAHASEIIALIRKHRLRYVEVPVCIRYTDYSQSKGQSVWNCMNIVIDLFLGRVFRCTSSKSS